MFLVLLWMIHHITEVKWLQMAFHIDLYMTVALFNISFSEERWVSKLFKCNLSDTFSLNRSARLSFIRFPHSRVVLQTKCARLHGTDLRTDDPPGVQRGQKLQWPHPAWADICAGRTGEVNWPDPTFHKVLSADDRFYPIAEEECT